MSHARSDWPRHGATLVLLVAVAGSLACGSTRSDASSTGTTTPELSTASASRAATSAANGPPTSGTMPPSALTEVAPGRVPTSAPTEVAAPSHAPSRTERRTFFSPTLASEMRYLVYLPGGYDGSPDRRYPVLYMLHGIGGDETEWQANGLLDAADRLIDAGAIRPLVIALPQGDHGLWIDHAEDGSKYGTYTARDVVGELDAHVRTIPDREHRAVGGLSIGADGALQLAITFPEVYSIVGAHSPTPLTPGESPADLDDPDLVRAHDPAALYHRQADVARGLRIWLDVAADDEEWHDHDLDFHNRLLADGVPHEWHDEWPGAHDGSYWSAHVDDYLRFYDRAFSEAGGAPAGQAR